jgi:hypothetical protein
MKTSTLCKKAKTRGLSARQRRFIEALAEGLNDRDAALKAGYSRATAEAGAFRIRRTLPVAQMLQSLSVAVAPPEKLVQRLVEILEGKVITTRTKKLYDADGIHTGSIIERVESQDNSASLHALLLLADWAGYAPPKPPRVIRIQHQHQRPWVPPRRWERSATKCANCQAKFVLWG